jgi:hypothetical protein
MADDDMLSVLDRVPGCSPGDGRPDCSLDMDPGLETLCGGGDVDVDVVGNGETNREPMACLEKETTLGFLAVHSAPAYAQMGTSDSPEVIGRVREKMGFIPCVPSKLA